jgi:uncharacterized membrane protein YfcA
MDGFLLGLFLLAAFLGGFASDLAGFAMGFVVSAIWLHIITPIQATTLIVGYGLLTQGYGVWKLRHALDWRRLTPFIVGGTIAIPIGTLLLTYIDPAYMRAGIGLLLVIYGAYGLAQPALRPVPAGAAADGGIGFFNGLLCGLTGLPGFIITVWCQVRGWSKDMQRAVFQPVMLAAIVVTAIALGLTGTFTAETGKLYLLGLPALLASLWLGFKLYGKLDDVAFRKLVLALLLVSGLSLTFAHGWPLIRDAQAAVPPLCRPALAITDVKFSEWRRPAMERTWSAVVSVDASRCTAGSTGTFEIGFLRLVEGGADVEFVERFAWSPPAVPVAVKFWASESVGRAWINSVSACPCAR